MSAIIPDIISQHAEEVSFLWLLRDAAVRAPHYALDDLKELDDRVDAHLDGLRIAGEDAWAFCEDALAHEEAGEVFAAGVVALDGGDREKLEHVFAVAQTSTQTERGLTSAFGWLEPEKSEGVIEDLLASDSKFHTRIGIAACAVRRLDPGRALAKALAEDDLRLRARACRAVGELGLADHLPALVANTKLEDDACRFWASWSAVLLGNQQSVRPLSTFVIPNAPFCERALQLLLRALGADKAQQWLRQLMEHPEAQRLLVQSAGIVGIPGAVPWLFEQMENPDLARVAGESFTFITGVDIAYDDLDGDWPEGFEAGPNEEADDENVEMDVDEDLPWPDVELIRRWWHENQSAFGGGGRYLAGRRIGADACAEVLRAGTQRQRAAAALEWTLLQPQRMVFETRAPGGSQCALLLGAEMK